MTANKNDHGMRLMAPMVALALVLALLPARALADGALSSPSMGVGADISAQTPPDNQRGMSYSSWLSGEYDGLASDRSLANLAATGAEWVALIVTLYQNDINSTTITAHPTKTATDADLVHAIQTAHALGLKVMLKPHVDLSSDPGQWPRQMQRWAQTPTTRPGFACYPPRPGRDGVIA